MTKELFSVFAGIFLVIGYVPYINAILRKKTMPSRATWIIWAFLDIITLAGMYAEHAVNHQILVASVGASIVSMLSFRYGVPGWTRTDKLCMGGAVAGVVLWKVFGNPTLGIVISLVIIFIGSIPTFESAWKDPSRENKTAWVILFISCVCATIAIPQWTLADASQPIVFFIIELIMIYILFCHSPKALNTDSQG